jgi:hypothetical protein
MLQSLFRVLYIWACNKRLVGSLSHSWLVISLEQAIGNFYIFLICLQTRFLLQIPLLTHRINNLPVDFIFDDFL